MNDTGGGVWKGPGQWDGVDAVASLARLLREGSPVHALVGAGLSARIGLPSWLTLLEELDPPARSVDGDGDGDGNQRVRDERIRRDLPWLAQLAEDKHPEALRAHLRKRLFLESIESGDPCIEKVVKLPFRHMLTTNFDNVLDLAHLKHCPEREHKILRWESADDRAVFLASLGDRTSPRHYLHLHGRADEPKSCVLTEEDYRERYIRGHVTARNLYAVFATQHVVFIGFSLSDVDLITILREVQALAGRGPARHFALLPRPPDGEAGHAAYFTKKYGVFPVFYPNETNRHEGLLPVLEDLEDLVVASGKTSEWTHVDFEAPPADGRERPDDANAGRFGAQAERDGYRLRLESVRNWSDDWATLTLTVERPGGTVSGSVAFFLHPTFPERVLRVQPVGGVARVTLHAWGAFTVGAIVRESGTRLELDLAPDERLGAVFRSR